MTFWDTPAGQRGLAARHMDRLVLNEERHGGPAEELVLDCTRCPYAIEAHLDGDCPDEATAIAAWGRS